MSSRTLMSLSISFAPIGTSFTSNSRLSSVASTQGSELWRVNGLNFSPSTGSPAMRPILGRPGLPTRELAQRVFHALREAAQRHRHAFALRHVELDLHRRLQPAQDLFRARGKRVEVAVGEVDARRDAREQEGPGARAEEQGGEGDRGID